MSRSMRTLLAATVAAGLFEVAQAPFIEVPAAPATIGAIFLLAALWIYRRPGIAPAVVLGLAFLVELAGVPTYERNTVTDWVVQIGFGVLSLVGLVAAIGVLVKHRRARAATQGVAAQASKAS
ncbi:MAG: hypothetical protein M3Q31_26685 [Actinomycetota bacterium]|nr:hypothetical protein [Actinomycetota bacterium]